MRIIFESCPIQSFEVLCSWIRFHLQNLSSVTNDPQKHILTFLNIQLQFLDEIQKFTNEILKGSLFHRIQKIYRKTGYSEVSVMEIPIDLRWNKCLHQKIIALLKQKHEDPDKVEYRYISCANRFSLELLLFTHTFVNELLAKYPAFDSLAKQADKVIRNQAIYEDSPLIALISIPRFIKALGDAIQKYLQDFSMPCCDEYFFKLYEIITFFSKFHRVFVRNVEKETEFKDIRLLGLHFCWLIKKVRNLYDDVPSMPPAELVNSAKFAETLLSVNNPEQRFRHRCLKWLGQPPVFPDARAAELYRLVVQLYQQLDLAEHIKACDIKVPAIKGIQANLESWLSTLCDSAFLSIYEKEQNIYSDAMMNVQDVRIQMIDTQVLIVEDDEIVEVASKPANFSKMSDTELMLEIQLLPLWDYLFITYEAEQLCNACILNEQNSELNLDKNLMKMFINWGNQVLGLNPVHIAHLVALQECQTNSLAPSIFYFLQHTRHGFSSDALVSLDFGIKDKNILNVSSVKKEWNCNYSWAKQQPVLTHIISTIHGKPGEYSLMCHFPLGTYFEKIDQLKKTQTLLWKHFDQLANKTKTFRFYTASIVVSWYNSLLSAIMALGDMSLVGFNKEDVIKLFDKLQISGLVTARDKSNILLLATDTIVELQAQLLQETSESDMHWNIGKAYVLVGLLTSVLMLPRDYIDPGLKAEAKCIFYRQFMADIWNETQKRKWITQMTCGQSLFNEWIAEHPHLKGLMELQNKFEEKCIATERKVPFRGKNEENFINLKSDCRHYIETIGSPTEILEVLANLGDIQDGKAGEDLISHNHLQKAQNFSKNLQGFIENMKKYILFPDLVYPFLVGVEQIIFGLSSCCHSYQMKEGVICGNSQKLNHVHEFLKPFSQLCTSKWKSSLHMTSSILNNSNLVTFKLILSFCKNSLPNRGRLMYKLIKSAILELINEIKIVGHRPGSKLKEMKKLLFYAFQFLYNAWQVQDERIKRKIAEEEKLYKYKTHANELSDEEKVAEELKQMFPSYEEEFNSSLNCNGDQVNQNCSTSINEDDGNEIHFTPVDMYEVCQLHATAISLFSDDKLKVEKKYDSCKITKSNLLIKGNREPDYITPFLLRHEVVSSIITSLGHRLDSFFDKNLLEGQLLRGYKLQKFEEGEENDYFDIYHDPSPVKVLAIIPVLHKLIKHVKSLLKEFPDNPNLINVTTVTERVLNFPVSDPLMKFGIGLEFVLEATQVWEQNAHSKVSLKEEIDEITKIIIEFRSKELDLWKKGLQSVIRKQYLNSSKWWFFMFPLFYSDSTYAESEKLVIVAGLQQCLEDSPIGEFPARLSILNIFLKEFQLHSSSKSSKSYSDILFNIYTYYEQFLPAVENEIQQIRKPIEKEIKDFVKIARWNDINFYAVKASIEKSHHCILRHVKAFEDALKKPAKTAFALPSKNSKDGEEFSWSLDINKEDYVCKQDKINRQEKTKYFKERKEIFFQKFPRYEKKIAKKSRQIADTFPVVGHVNTLNDFCGNIIEALQSVTAEGRKSVCTRSREKKESLIKVQNKKQMLSTLFKNLKAIGLSYRQGIVHHKQVSILMSTPVFDISQMKVLKADHEFEKLLSKSSRDTNHYFYKSLAQYAQLEKCMESPSKDLTLDIIHRIQGYGGHLLNLVTSQRENIANLCQDIDDFGSFLSLLSKVYDNQKLPSAKTVTVIPPQQYLQESDVDLNNLMIILMLTTGHFDALLDSAPESSFLAKEHHSPELDKIGFSGILKGDDFWSGIKNATKVFNCDIETLFQQLSKLKLGQTLVTWEEMKACGIIYESLQNSLKKLIEKVSVKDKPDCAIVENLLNLYNRVSHKCKMYKEEEVNIFESQKVVDSGSDCDRATIFNKLCQKLATEVLLAIQEMVLFSSSAEEDKSNANVVPEGLFTVKISNSLLEAKNCLHLDKILKLIKRLKVHVSRFQKSMDKLLPSDKSLRLLVNLAPLLNQYYQLVKVYLAITMGMHRSSCKFLSILLEIFNILAVQGFCIPPELQEEAAKAGATKFEDIESGGLGEGEGMKDVSGKIETEDQLDDAFKEGEEKKDKDDQKDKDIKDEEDGIEMSNDFEGKAHSGEKDEDSGEEDNEEESDELDKQMGDVGEDDTEKLDDKVWGSDSENEDELKDADESGGVTENAPSELAAKDDKYKEDADKGDKDKGEQPQNVPLDEETDEYSGEKPDPMINAPPEQEPEVSELPEDMEITDDVEKDGPDVENMDEITEPGDKLDDSKEESNENDTAEEVTTETDKDQTDAESKEDRMGGKSEIDLNDAEEPMEESEDQIDEETLLPTKTPTTEVQALSSEMKQKSSDDVKSNEAMDWETGAQNTQEQHREGLSDASSMPNEDPGHEGKKSSATARELTEKPYNPKLKPPGEHRTLDESAEEQSAKNRHIQDRKNTERSYESNQDDADMAEMYEHVSKEEEGTTTAIDIATKEQADKRAVENQLQDGEEEEEIIEISSGDEDEETYSKPVGDSFKTNSSQKSGDRGEVMENPENLDIPEGEHAQTQIAPRGAESTIHTQNELWKSISCRTLLPNKSRNISIKMTAEDLRSCSSDELWKVYEGQVSSLSQELCEQLRLVLEPTKMSKFKGDFRTGKRLNMRKIIPYIASQFRKDKIWLRRTKPTKRQYQIMLAVDDSSSMSDNNSKQLAFESLAVLGQSLTLLEAGELSVVSFGESVKLLHGFQEQFSSNAGAKILEQFTFSQKKTKIAQLLNYATDLMVQARSSARSAALSKETAQLLIIISDGRGILNEGDNTVKTAVKNARDNNIFMVFLILDNPDNKVSILDITCPVFASKTVTGFIPYMDKFPFPFYIILREISALPQVLGEALRQWFELVTSVDR